ncbi:MULTISPECIES: hypothetical protein [Bacillota]|uniref:hypothetical protein n=1 Tax=Bacillota TaxID=1239 RepID=UPI0013C36294|nr:MULTISPECIES: hypothetical protein [Bacillota]
MSLENDLESAILKINSVYNKLSIAYTGEIFNFRKEKVKDIIDDDSIIKDTYQNIFDNYRQFLADNQLSLFTLSFDLDDIFDDDLYKINERIKAANSIYEKLRRYCDKKEKGDISLNKCLNDFFGIRMVFTDLIENKQNVLKTLEKLKENKVIKRYYVRNDGEYSGIHITLNGNDNLRFPWELQLWDKSKFESNMNAHDLHKEMTKYTNIPKHYFTKMEL